MGNRQFISKKDGNFQYLIQIGLVISCEIFENFHITSNCRVRISMDVAFR